MRTGFVAAILTRIAGSAEARQASGFALVALTILLFLLNLRRAGERAGRAAERRDARERSDAIHRQMLDAASRRPHDGDALADRLRDGRF